MHETTTQNKSWNMHVEGHTSHASCYKYPLRMRAALPDPDPNPIPKAHRTLNIPHTRKPAVPPEAHHQPNPVTRTNPKPSANLELVEEHLAGAVRVLPEADDLIHARKAHPLLETSAGVGGVAPDETAVMGYGGGVTCNRTTRHVDHIE